MTEPPEPPETARAEFDNVICQQLRDAWVLHGKLLTTPDGKRYDVSGWIDGHWEFALEFTGRHDNFYFARLDAVTAVGPAQRVTCELRIAEPAAVWVDRETPVDETPAGDLPADDTSDAGEPR